MYQPTEEQYLQAAKSFSQEKRDLGQIVSVRDVIPYLRMWDYTKEDSSSDLGLRVLIESGIFGDQVFFTVLYAFIDKLQVTQSVLDEDLSFSQIVHEIRFSYHLGDFKVYFNTQVVRVGRFILPASLTTVLSELEEQEDEVGDCFEENLWEGRISV